MIGRRYRKVYDDSKGSAERVWHSARGESDRGLTRLQEYYAKVSCVNTIFEEEFRTKMPEELSLINVKVRVVQWSRRELLTVP